MSPEEGGNELGVNKSGFFVFESSCDFSCETEIGILIDRAGDQTGDVGAVTVDLGEGVGERGSGLDRDKVPLSDIVTGETISVS